MGRRHLTLILAVALFIPAGSLFAAAAADAKLIDAVKKSDLQAVNALLKLHPNVNAKTPDGTTAIHWAVTASRTGNVDVVKMLLSAGANPDAKRAEPRPDRDDD